MAFLRGHIRHTAELAAPLNRIKDPGKGKKASNAPISLDPSQMAAFETLRADLAIDLQPRRPASE
jgi:hypothetical protein